MPMVTKFWKKLKPLLTKSEPDRKYTQNVLSDDNLPALPDHLAAKYSVINTLRHREFHTKE